MIEQATLQFLKELKKNNKKDWFEKNRNRFEAAKRNFEDFTAAVIKKLGSIDESIAHLIPKECTFRQNRDVRFSKDKSPYKVNMGMYLSKGGRKGIQAGYYFHLEPGKSLIGGGLWMPMATELKKVRQEIDYNWNEFEQIIRNKKFQALFGDLDRNKEYVLSRPPKGYEHDNPAIEYLKFKSWIASVNIEDGLLTSKHLLKKTVYHFEALKPLIDFLNEGAEG